MTGYYDIIIVNKPLKLKNRMINDSNDLMCIIYKSDAKYLLIENFQSSITRCFFCFFQIQELSVSK